MARILVTGATGFIGSRIAHELNSEGNEVLGIDNFNTYYNPELKMLRQKDLLENIEIYDLDLKEIDSTRKIFGKFKPDSVLHFAGQPGVRVGIESWNLYAERNLLAFSNTLQSAIQVGASNFMYASSSSVYGDLLGKTNERMLGLHPQSYYGATKLSNEILANSVDADLRIRGLRFFSVYGEYGRPDMAYFKLAASILTGKTFEKFGPGDVKRDFTHISDVSNITRELLNQLELCPSGFRDVVNIGGGNPHTLNELIVKLSTHLGEGAKIENKGSNVLDSKETHADTSYLYSLIELRHQIDFELGIKKFADWIGQYPSETIANWIK